MPKSVVLDELIRKQVLPRFPLGETASVSPLDGGLINQSFLVSLGETRFVLQRVNAVFPPTIHDNIRAVTEALVHAGLVTPTLVPTNDGRLCLELALEGGPGEEPSVWRLMTHVDGVSFDVVAGPDQAHAAGALVARFHSAVEDLSHAFVGQRTGVHDTPRHLENLRQTMASHQGHRLFGQVAPLAERILTDVRSLAALPPLPPRICHGDLKFNNLIFAGLHPPACDHAVCLIDLDTVGPSPLAYELGDAWRSWCNRNSENVAHADLDLELFEASLDGYRIGLARDLHSDERRALLLGPEWISLELAARFAADALGESYFGWDAIHFVGRGEHNLVRAAGQWSLHKAFVSTRPRRAHLLDLG